MGGVQGICFCISDSILKALSSIKQKSPSQLIVTGIYNCLSFEDYFLINTSSIIP